nr:protein PFC0760c-like [Aegilops tauschii subsp. strangulata]
MKGDLVKFLMKCYDPELSQLVIPDRGKIPVDAASIERIWGLPRGQRKVAYEVEPDVVRLFNETFNIPTRPVPTVTEWCKMINDMGVVADDKFLSAWLIVVYSCFLAPTTSLKVSPRAYSVAQNPQEEEEEEGKDEDSPEEESSDHDEDNNDDDDDDDDYDDDFLSYSSQPVATKTGDDDSQHMDVDNSQPSFAGEDDGEDEEEDDEDDLEEEEEDKEEDDEEERDDEENKEKERNGK